MSRLLPLTGPETDRVATLGGGHILSGEIHTTNDQGRTWLKIASGDYLAGPIYHGEVADETEMIALNTTARGCWPMDVCKRADTSTLWICVAGNGTSAGNWIELAGGASAASTVQNKSAITGLTGGGATNLDGQNATSANIGELWDVYIAGVGISRWRVEALAGATDVAAEPPQIRAANWTTSTNEIGFIQRG